VSSNGLLHGELLDALAAQSASAPR
jgi:hypothetical protein